MLASSVAGCPVDLDVASPGAPTWAEPGAIHVARELVDAPHLRRAVLIQAALIGAGSLAPEVVAPLRRRPRGLPRYLTLEVARSCHELRIVLPSTLPELDLPVRTADAAGSVRLALDGVPVVDPLPEWGQIRLTGRGPARPVLRPWRVLTDGADPAGDDDVNDRIGVDNRLRRLLNRLLDTSQSESASLAEGAVPTIELMPGHRRGTVHGSAVPGDGRRLARPECECLPEWDHRRHRYRPGWCQVHETNPEPSGLPPLPVPTDRRLAAQLATMQVGLERVPRRADGDDIDIDGVIRARTAARAGGEADDRIFLASRHRLRDLGVLLLLDSSGSVRDPSPSGGTVHEHQVQLAAALGSAFDLIGFRVSLYAFSSFGRHHVRVFPLKRFGETFDSTARARLGSLDPVGFTRLGAAVRAGTDRLLREAGTRHRLLVVISDGLPLDDGYRDRYAMEDSRRALDEARSAAVGCLCLSVGAQTGHHALRHVFGTSAFAAAADVDGLRRRLPAMVHLAVASAERRSLSHRGPAGAGAR